MCEQNGNEPGPLREDLRIIALEDEEKPGPFPGKGMLMNTTLRAGFKKHSSKGGAGCISTL